MVFVSVPTILNPCCRPLIRNGVYTRTLPARRHTTLRPPVSHSESNIQARTRLAATAKRWRLWRNNRGAAKTDSGSYIRFGLANDSKTIGDVLKAGDLIGWRPVIITADMVGKVLAQIVSVECK